jgi:hypothetical protein
MIFIFKSFPINVKYRDIIEPRAKPPSNVNEMSTTLEKRRLMNFQAISTYKLVHTRHQYLQTIQLGK